MTRAGFIAFVDVFKLVKQTRSTFYITKSLDNTFDRFSLMERKSTPGALRNYACKPKRVM